MANDEPLRAAYFLRRIDDDIFPLTKEELIAHVVRQGANEDVVATFERLPEEEVTDPHQLSRAFGELEIELRREERERALAEPLAASRGTWQKYTYQAGTEGRDYYVYTPANYQPGSTVPLVLMLHGCRQTPEDIADVTQMNQLADQKQFIVVYPQQTRDDNQGKCWNWFLESNQSRDSGELAILAGITQTVQQTTDRWTIDPRRVYVAGLSAGAAMSVLLGVAYPDRFAAIGVHSGLEYKAATSVVAAFLAMYLQGGPDPMLQGQRAYHVMGSVARVVPTIVFHGTSDLTVKLLNGDQVTRQMMETNRLASQGGYAAAFHKPSSTTPGQVPGGRSYTVYAWNDSSGNVVQAYWKVDGMDHAWSGGGAGKPFSDPSGPNASLAMYQFFLDHPLS